MLPSWYPTAQAPLNGVFFREQALALRRQGVDASVAYPELVGPRTLWARGNFGDLLGRCEVRDEGGLPTWRSVGFGSSRGSVVGLAWTAWAQRLVDRFVADRGRPDLIHAHSAAWPNAAGLAARIAARRLGVPYVVTEHSSSLAVDRMDRASRILVREAFSGAAALVAVSSFLRDRVARFVPGADIRVIPNLVDTAFFQPAPARRTGGVFRFLAVAWLHPPKAIDVLLRAFARAFAKESRVVLEVGGDGPARGDLEGLAASLGIADRVGFLGALTRNQVREALWRADGFVLPSLVETFGVVLIEAMATGLPVVATRCGGPGDVVEPGTGLLVQPGSVDDLADAMRRVVRDRATFDPAFIRSSADTRFGEPAVAGRIVDLYRQVLQGPRA